MMLIRDCQSFCPRYQSFFQCFYYCLWFRFFLKHHQVPVGETQFFQIWYTGKLDHGWWSTHENLSAFRGTVKQTMGGNHFLANKSNRTLPRTTGRSSIDGIMKRKTIGKVILQTFQNVLHQNVIHGYNFVWCVSLRCCNDEGS
jgi:hypothetical protein